jgi:hypothetical protein
MTAGGWLFVSLVTLALAGVVALYLHRRRLAREKARLEAQAAPPPKRYWGKQLIIPPHGHVCLAARNLADRRFKLDDAPHLPLTECTCKFDCRCSYRMLEERRSGNDRRSGRDRRPAIRYDPDKPPRRSGRDRRKDKDTPFNDYVI